MSYRDNKLLVSLQQQDKQEYCKIQMKRKEIVQIIPDQYQHLKTGDKVIVDSKILKLCFKHKSQ